MGNVVRLRQGRAPVSQGSFMGKLRMMFWALFLAASMMALCLPAEAFSWGALAGRQGVLGGICLQKGGTVCLGLLGMRLAPQRAELGMLCCGLGFDAAAFLPAAEQLWTTEVWAQGVEGSLTGYAAAPS